MKNYVFGVPISGYQIYRVSANSEEEAREKLINGEYCDFNTPEIEEKHMDKAELLIF